MQNLSSSRRVFRTVSVASFMITGGLAVAACGGPGAGFDNTKNGGQSSLMEKSFAGANKCNPKNHNRPFIIEWDATDMSSFQAHTNNDVVVVKYEGCELQVLEGCRDDSNRGSFGTYKPIDWTSGSVESLDIKDEGELYAKLPLGAASLGGRVSHGEKFHMEYYVSGTRTATRDKLTKNQLAKISACAGATHYVYSYNLGAFALASQKELKGEVNGSYFGFGAGGSKATETKADKKGGELPSCKGESSKEVDTCKVPIRLSLREIAEGDDDDTKSAQAPETDEAKNLAGRLKASTDAEKKAQEHGDAASTKLASRDGKGCLDELNQHDKLDPRPGGLSTSPKGGYWAMVRGQCLMLAGQCEAGRLAIRKQQEAAQGANGSPEQIDKMVDAMAGIYCQGGKLAPRDQFIKARQELTTGAFMSKKDSAYCMSAFNTIWGLKDSVKPKDDDDVFVKDPLNFLLSAAPACLVKAGDCDGAYKVYKQIAGELYKQYPWSKDEKQLRTNFETMNKKCATTK